MASSHHRNRNDGGAERLLYGHDRGRADAVQCPAAGHDGGAGHAKDGARHGHSGPAQRPELAGWAFL